jgi:hypothetical protein
VHFEIAHEFDAGLDALEQAVLSPQVGPEIGRRLPAMFEQVETVRLERQDDAVVRVIRFQAAAPLAMFRAYAVAREAMCWEEVWTYRLDDHASTWSVRIADQFSRYFQSNGTYRLERAGTSRTRRIVEGRLDVGVALIRAVAERVAIREVRKTYEAEAETLRALSSAA